MQTYIDTLLTILDWPKPRKPQLSTFIATHIAYGHKTQLTPEEDTSAPLSAECLLQVQKIIGSLLYYARAVDNKLLVVLNANAIAARQSNATIRTEQLVHTLQDYVATYPNDGIVYRASDMVLCAHADAGYLKETKSQSRAGAHIDLSEDDPIPHFKVLTIATINKFVMALAAKAELAALFIAARKMVPPRQTLIDMGWSQPRSPVQTDNSTAIKVTTRPSSPRGPK